MDHLDLAMNMKQESVYSSNSSEDGVEMSERISGLASCIYAEFERMMEKYDRDVVENLMPLVVNVLEQLESSYKESNEQSVELEMLVEDNEQLITQYEREKQLRKLAESKYFEFEDSRDQDRQEQQNLIDTLETQRKQDEIKIKHLQEQNERIEERFAEQKKEYDTLHARHSEMLRAYVERMDNNNRMSPVPSDADIIRCNSFQGIIPAEPVLSTSESILADEANQMALSSQLDAVAIADEDDDHNLSLVDEIGNEVKQIEQTGQVAGGQQTAAASEAAIPENTEIDNQNLTPKSKSRKKLQLDGITSDLIHPKDSGVGDEQGLVISGSMVSATGSYHMAGSVLDTAVDSEVSRSSTSTPSKFLSPEAIAIIQSTPELAGKLDGETIESFNIEQSNLDQIESVKSSRNDLSLSAEFNSQNTDNVIAIDSATKTELKGSKEVEMVLNENRELTEVRNKLQTQKNDLLRRVEEILREKELNDEA